MLCQCGTRCSNDPSSPRALYVARVKWRGTDGPGGRLRRVANVASEAPVPLQSVSLQYWFNGPDGVAQFETAAPNDLFQLKCSDATTGECGGPARRPPLPLRWWERLPAGRGGGVLERRGSRLEAGKLEHVRVPKESRAASRTHDPAIRSESACRKSATASESETESACDCMQ